MQLIKTKLEKLFNSNHLYLNNSLSIEQDETLASKEIEII